MKTASLALLLLVSSMAAVQAQDSLSEPAQGVPALGEPSSESLASFRKVLLAQADAAVQEKGLNIGARLKARTTAMLLRAATRNEAVLAKFHQYAAEQVLADGQAQSYGAIDWTKLAAFIKEMIPIIMELIKLFAVQGQYQTHNICDLVPTGYTVYQSSGYHLAA